MLLYFSASNFRSIDETIELNLLSNNRLRHHKDHVKKPLKKDRSIGVLKTAVLYGSNAAGKSNIFKAVDHALKIVCGRYTPKKNLRQEPFKLNEETNNKSSDFYFEFSLNGLRSVYSFSYKENFILKESLDVYGSKDKHTNIFCRERDGDKTSIKSDLLFPIDKKLALEKLSQEHDTSEDLSNIFNDFEVISAMQRTPTDKLVLSEIATRNFSEFKNFSVNTINAVYDYFKTKMVVVYPESRYQGVSEHLKKESGKSSSFVKNLIDFNTGISGLSSSSYDISNMDSFFLETLEKGLKNSGNQFEIIELNDKHVSFYIDEETGELKAELLRTLHKNRLGKEISFEVSEESDGTKRLFDLLPAICLDSEIDETQHSGVTYFIDEFNRSLHPAVARKLLLQFLDKTANNNCQFIVSTHESELLDFKFLRRDEIYFVQKENDGATELYALDEYSTRFDKDIRRAYLSGKFGAIPFEQV